MIFAMWVLLCRKRATIRTPTSWKIASRCAPYIGLCRPDGPRALQHRAKQRALSGGDFAHYRATGDRTLLDAGMPTPSIYSPSRLWGWRESNGNCGWTPQIEMSLIELYLAGQRAAAVRGAAGATFSTGDDAVPAAARPDQENYCLRNPLHFKNQARGGYAVRAMYACCGAETDHHLETGYSPAYLRLSTRCWMT